MRFWDEQKVYGQHVLALFAPGTVGAVHAADPNTPGDVTKWPKTDRTLLIEEGRRQIDRQNADLERVRGRSQFLLGLALALTGTVAALIEKVHDVGCGPLWVVWTLAVASGAWSALGAAATAVVAAEPEIIHSTVLSTYAPPVEAQLAADYAEAVVAGEDHLAVRLTNLRWSVGFLLISALLALGSWSWAELE